MLQALFCTGNQSIQLAVNWALDHNEESSNDSMELGQIQSTSTNGHLKVNDSGSSSFKKVCIYFWLILSSAMKLI